MIPVFCGFTAAKIIKLSEFCRKTCSNFAFFFYFCSYESRLIFMLNTCKSLIINIMGGVNLCSMLSHTLNPRQAEMVCLSFFFVLVIAGGAAQGDAGFGPSESPLPPFLKGEARSDAELGSGRPAPGRLPPLEGVPAGRGSQKNTPAGQSGNPEILKLSTY